VVFAASLGLVLCGAPAAAASPGTHRSSKRHCVLIRTKGHSGSRRCDTTRRRQSPAGRAGSIAYAATGPAPSASPAIHCDVFASPGGSDTSGNGTLANPYATLAMLDRSLSPGQTGCLRGGSYGGVDTDSGLEQSGRNGARITISSYPGEVATVHGWVDIEASYTTVSHLKIDGSNTFYRQRRADTTCRYPVSQGLAIAGHDDIFEYDNYYQSVPSLRGNGLGVGWWGDADNTIIRYNKIHDVGGCDLYDQMIYLDSGNDVQIYDNWLWNDSHGWGIKLDPGPTNARIWGNVIDAAGSGFGIGNSSGTNPTAGNQVFDNIVVDSVGISNPDIGWSHPGVLVTSPGLLSNSTGNRVYDNDSYANAGGLTDVAAGVSHTQLTVTGNATANPQFVNAPQHDYQVQPDSGAAGWPLWNGN